MSCTSPDVIVFDITSTNQCRFATQKSSIANVSRRPANRSSTPNEDPNIARQFNDPTDNWPPISGNMGG
jgi:hypothetical protein